MHFGHRPDGHPDMKALPGSFSRQEPPQKQGQQEQPENQRQNRCSPVRKGLPQAQERTHPEEPRAQQERLSALPLSMLSGQPRIRGKRMPHQEAGHRIENKKP